GGGGGVSQFEDQRATPDVTFNADPVSGVAVFDSFNNPQSPWVQAGGTSLGAPAWASLIAVVNQGRALQGHDALGGAAAIAQLPNSDFHDVGAGRGSPIANSLILNLVNATAVTNVGSDSTPPAKSKGGV